MPHLNFFFFTLALFLLQLNVVQSNDGIPVPHMFMDGKPGKPGIIAARQGNCLQQSLDFCQKGFADNLRTDVKIFKNPQLFTALINGIYKKDITNGFLNMCAARNEFATCLGDNYRVCTDIFNLIGQQKYSREDAFTLAGIYNNMDFDCSSGFTQLVDNWPCVVLVHNSDAYKTKSKACSDTYNSTTRNNPDAFCFASQVYSLCLADIYNDPSVNACDFKDLMWWECERALSRSKLDGFCNTTNCQKLFDKKSKNEFLDLVDFMDKGGLFHKALRQHFKNANKLAYRRLSRQSV